MTANLSDGAMSQPAEEFPSQAQVAILAKTVAQAWALCHRLLSVGLGIGCGMFIGHAAASHAVAGGFELGLSSAAKTILLLSHAERIHDLATAVENAVLAAHDSPTQAELAVVFMRACRLAAACADACDVIPEEP